MMKGDEAGCGTLAPPSRRTTTARRFGRGTAEMFGWCLVAVCCLNAVRVHLPIHDLPGRLLAHREKAAYPSGTSIGKKKLRILYILTSMSEFDSGLRQTKKGNDRFTHTLLPVAQESIHSMLSTGTVEVDFYLITHYPLSLERREQVRRALPPWVGVQVWDDATPLGYDNDQHADKGETHIVPVMRSLARQHRYVIKDKFRFYDFFCAFEDDMVIKGSHIQHYRDLTQMLYELRQRAPNDLPIVEVPTVDEALVRFHGPMTKVQLERCIPGFIRVEVALPGFKPHKRNLVNIPIDYMWQGGGSNARSHGIVAHVNASICCHLNASFDWLSHQTPTNASASQLHYWETSIEALRIRQLPNREWVLLQGGNIDVLYEDPSYVVGGYWVGQTHAVVPSSSTAAASSQQQQQASPPNRFAPFLGNLTRPDPTKGRYLNNQGGWMATRRQIRDWHVRHCRGGFLPPYDATYHYRDGLDSKTVEYWSGGISIAGVMSCNLQRVVSLDPNGFSHHLLYHVSNNKQRENNLRYRFSSHTIDEFWAQLNAVQKSAAYDQTLDETALRHQETIRREEDWRRVKEQQRESVITGKSDGVLFE